MRKWGILILSILGFFLSTCSKTNLTDQLPLVLTLPWLDDADCAKIGMTDSLIYVLKVFKLSSEGYEILLLREALADSSGTDSLRFPSSGVGSFSSTPDLEGIRLPTPNMIVSPLPIGDTSGMIRFGSCKGEFSRFFTRDTFKRRLREIGLLFYLIDVGSEYPLTLASFEGEVFDASYPYILLRTGLRFLRDTTRYSGMRELSVTENAEQNKEYCLAIDLETIDNAASVRTTFLNGGAQVMHSLMLTCDGKLLVVKQDSLESDEISSNVKVYLIEKKEFMREIEYNLMMRLFSEKEYRLLDNLHITKPCWLSDLLFRRNIPFRAYVL